MTGQLPGIPGIPLPVNTPFAPLVQGAHDVPDLKWPILQDMSQLVEFPLRPLLMNTPLMPLVHGETSEQPSAQ